MSEVNKLTGVYTREFENLRELSDEEQGAVGGGLQLREEGIPSTSPSLCTERNKPR